ncbi:helix-turn-helix domain-containing protein [Achromobacter sp.]|uniref:helix-turn-helix domain-containing protein n=1 Tax=Achromobacter sp. TaxID=134375 RepID=UPI002F954758
MLTILDTQSIDPGCRFAAFRQAVCEIASLGAHRSGESAFNARIRRSRVGFCECSFVDFDAVTIERRLTDIERDRKGDYLLALHVDGNVRMKQLDRELCLGPGDFAIFDSALPYRIEVDSPARRVVMRFPRNEFSRRGLASDAVCGRTYSGERGTSAIASRLLGMLAGEPADLVSAAGHSLASTLLDLIAEADNEDGTSALVRPAHDHILRRIRTIVLTHLSNPELSVARVAELAGISLRYLHQVFSVTGTTVHKWIEAERLERAWCALRSQHQRQRSIQEIALDCGFNDPGHFSRRFAKRYGQTPSRLRAGGRKD